MRNKIIACMIFCLVHNASAKAQIVPAPEGKTVIDVEAECRGTENVGDAVDGKLYAHMYASHNFLYSDLQKLGIEGRYEYNSSDLHYFRLALKGNKVFRLSNHRSIVDDIYTRHGSDKLRESKKGTAPFILARAVVNLK